MNAGQGGFTVKLHELLAAFTAADLQMRLEETWAEVQKSVSVQEGTNHE